MSRPTAAPAHFPYAHRTLAEVDLAAKGEALILDYLESHSFEALHEGTAYLQACHIRKAAREAKRGSI